MACPFAQLSPLLLLSFLVLFLQYGASFFSPKPLLASIHRGRSLVGSSCKPVSSPSAGNRSGGGKGDGAGAKGGKPGGPRLLGVAGDVLASPNVDQMEGDHTEELLEDPLPWKESMSSGRPLFYSSLLRQQAITLQLGLGLDRVPCPRGMCTVCNEERKARVRNAVYSGDRVRKLRMSYLDTPGMQVFTSVAYSAGAYDFPILGVSAMAMGRVRVVALDLQPLFQGADYMAKYAKYFSRLAALRKKYPQLTQDFVSPTYKGSPFFSENILYARWGPEEEAAGFMEKVVMPAYQEVIETYMDLVSEAKQAPYMPGSAAEHAILERQAEFDRFHAEREQVRPVMTANFGSAWAKEYVSSFLYAYSGGSE